MKNTTIVKGFLVFLIFAMLLSCTKTVKPPIKPVDDGKEVVEKDPESSHQLSINLNVLNKDESSDTYYVYFVLPGQKETEPGKATQSGKSKPYESDSSGNLTIDLKEDYDLQYMISHPESIKPNTLELYVTTKEDIYIRNPLNEKTVIDFDVVIPEDSVYPEDYLFTSSQLNLDITDKYPDGVVSLTFPDAVFVVKLNFDPPTEKSAYEVSLFLPSDQSENGIGMIRVGRLARAFQYWDTQFYTQEVTGTRAVVIMDTDTNEVIEYEGYPLWLEFNDDGTCKDGDIINIKMPPGS